MSSLNRRQFIELLGASMALAALSGCAPIKAGQIVPTVLGAADPADIEIYTTALEFMGVMVPAVGRCLSGRPVKLDGHPSHPETRGRSDVTLQAALLSLYDPDRSGEVRDRNVAGTWEGFNFMLSHELRPSTRLRLLTGPLSSPTLLGQVRQLRARYPNFEWHTWDPTAGNMLTAAQQAFGRPLVPRYQFDRADRVVSLDADFLGQGPSRIRYATEFSATRRYRQEGPGLSRLYSYQRVPSLTSANADRQTPVNLAELHQIVSGGEVEKLLAGAPGLVLVADDLPAWMHLYAWRLNHRHGVLFQSPPTTQGADLPSLMAAMTAGQVDLLVMSGVNPGWTAPGFDAALAHVPMSVHHGVYVDETAARCTWHVPATHDLEGWRDGRAADGTLLVAQPLIEPLFGGKTAVQVLAALLGDSTTPAYDLLRGAWKVDDNAFSRWLIEGYQAGTAFRPVDVSPAAVQVPAAPTIQGFELVVRPHPYMLDGSFSNNAWLQELPQPLTALTWDNVVGLGPRTAQRLGVDTGALVEIGGVRGPVWVGEEHGENVVSLTLGYGRQRAGRVGNSVGYNAYPLLGQSSVEVHPTGERRELATTQLHHAMHERQPVRYGTVSHVPAGEGNSGETLYAAYDYSGYKWGMVIDLSTCIGCNACTIACQAENNIPVVGRDEVLKHREMHWIRVDSYRDNDQILFQPVPCMQCENAPCELVCPVGATVHSTEGLNDMVYNRCVGTRYCSNNCPYKVRRFNFLQYSPLDEPLEELHFNPEVSVRPRGVMEKCNYCVQRIDAARARAETDNRFIRTGEVRTACQEACPTASIIFGNLNDSEDEVTRLQGQPHRYSLLAELNTRPRTTYLARVRADEV